MVKDDNNQILRQLPSVDWLLQTDEISTLAKQYPRTVIIESIRRVLNSWRIDLCTPEKIINPSELETGLINDILTLINCLSGPNLKPVINATGVILHTNLGRAVLSEPAQAAVNSIGTQYSNLEFDLTSGKRGSRHEHVNDLLCSLTGAEASLIVNNNAAAVMLVLNTLAQGKEAIVSRGQLVEIGGSFRIPEVMAMSGACLIEIGTTNRTYLKDYQQATNENTALWLKVHTSNYQVIGFTHEENVKTLAAGAHAQGIPLLSDVGSGCIINLANWGITGEPVVQEEIAAGADVVTFSGDKLLGGPQAGIIVGKREIIARLASNPLTRALRIDKMTLAALEATLRAYYDPAIAVKEIPTLAMLTTAECDLLGKAEELTMKLQQRVDCPIAISKGISYAGGGALPGKQLDTYLVTVKPNKNIITSIAKQLLASDPPLVIRIQSDNLVLDVRTILANQIEQVVEILASALSLNRWG